jgi:hypothetical protein
MSFEEDDRAIRALARSVRRPRSRGAHQKSAIISAMLPAKCAAGLSCGLVCSPSSRAVVRATETK